MKHFYKFCIVSFFFLLVVGTTNAQQKLDPANYITVDNPPNLPQGGTADTPEYFEVGPWFNGVSASGFGGNYRQTSQLGGVNISGRTATWVLNVLPDKQGKYLVYVYVLHAFNSALNVYYTIRNEFSTINTDSVRHNQQRSNRYSANPSVVVPQVTTGAWVPIMFADFNVGKTFVTVGADTITGNSIMRADAIRILKGISGGPDLEFGRRLTGLGFDTARVGDSWVDASLGSITYKEYPLYNLGTSDLIITNIKTTTFQNRWDIKLPEGGNYPFIISPGQSKKIAIGFRPFQEEYIPDTLIIESNDPNEPIASLFIDGSGINYNFILNASITNEPHYNAPFDALGNAKRPQMILQGNWLSSGTGPSAFPFPIAGGNIQGIFSFDAVSSIEYRFQLPDSVNGKPGSTGNYFVEFGAIPFTSNSENAAQITIIPAFSIDTLKTIFNQSGLTIPPFFVVLGNKPIAMNQGDITSVKISRAVTTAPVLRADLLRIRKIPTGPTIAATPQANFGNVSIYQNERNIADNYRKDIEINSGGESALRIDSIVLSNPRYYSLKDVPATPFLLPAVNGTKKFTVLFTPDTIANTRIATLRIYSNDTTKNPYNIALTGNGVGTGLVIEETDVVASYVYPANPVPFQDLANINKWQISTSGSGGSSLLGYIYKLQGDPVMPNKSGYVEYFPAVPILEGRGPELDTFRVFARTPVGSSNSSPTAKYTIFPGAGGNPIEVVLNQNNRGDRVFLGAAVFLRSNSRDAHGGGAINGFIRLENDTNLVSAYYKDSLVNRARRDSFVIRADAIILQESLTGVEYEVLPNVPTQYDLSQNFPNPFNPSTRIRFDLPNSENVQLRVYDILGREVRTLVNERYDGGSYMVTWDGKNDYGRQVATGVYIYQLRAGNFISTKKMLMLK